MRTNIHEARRLIDYINKELEGVDPEIKIDILEWIVPMLTREVSRLDTDLTEDGSK